MKKQRGKKRLEREVKIANRRLQSMRSKGYGNLTVIERALAEFEKYSKQSNAKIFSMSGIDTPKKQRLLKKQIGKFLNSEWTTDIGRKNILQKRIKSFMQNPETGGKWGLSESETLLLFDVFATDEYHKAIEKGMLSSEQVIDIIRKNNDTNSSEFENALKSLVKSETPPDESRIFIEDAIKNDSI